MAQTKASLIDLNSNELILDLDGDTTLHSSTDDQIDIKIAGADDFTFTAGAFNVLASSHAVFADSSEAKFGAGTDLQIYHDGTDSFIANKTGALKIATETSGIAITIGHTTSEVTVADNLTVTGNANIGGSLTFADGSIALADLDIDGATDIGAAIVDADLFIVDDGAGGTNRKVAASRIKTYIGSTTAVDDLTLGDAAVTIATSSGNITIDAQAGDTDIIFKGTDSSADITALTLDMSDAGTAVFNHDIRIADDGQIGSASDADAIVINSSGVVTMNQIPVFSAGLNVSGGTIAGTLSTAAQGNVTSLGTLTALTVDDMTLDGSAISDSGDFTIDGGADIILDADGGDIFFKDDGTTFGSATNTSGNLIIKSGTTTAATFSGANVTFAGTVGSGAITSTGIVTGTGFTAGNAVLAESELELLDGLTAGTAIASKVVTTDANIDSTGMRNLTISGELDAATGDFSGAVDVAGAITSSSGATITVSDNSDNLTLTCTDADGSAGPNLRMYRNSSSPDDGNDLGVIDFEGRNDNSQDVVYAQIKSLIVDQTDGTEDGKLEFYHMLGGSLAPSLQLTNTEVVINESSNDIDFRVESDGNTHMLHVDGGNNNVGIGAAATQAKLHIITNDSGALNDANSDDFMIENTSATGMTIGSSNTGEGHIHFSDSDDADVCAISYFHSSNNLVFRVNTAETLRLGDSMEVSTGGETTPDVSDGGICLNQGSDDTNAMTFKSSDIAHGVTGEAETDTYAILKKLNGSLGGFQIKTFTEDVYGLYQESTATNENTTTTVNGIGNIHMKALLKSGTGRTAHGVDANIFAVASSNTKFIVKGDGDIYYDGADQGTYDTYEDAQLVRAYDKYIANPATIIDSKFDQYIKYNKKTLEDAQLIGVSENGEPPLVSLTGFQRLHNGAIWQQYEKHQKLAEAVYEMAKEALGEEKADAILEKHDIKLLN